MSQHKSVHSSKYQDDNPCVRNCCLDDNDVCLGCFRTLKEILGWRALTKAGREQVMIDIEKRRISNTC